MNLALKRWGFKWSLGGEGERTPQCISSSGFPHRIRKYLPYLPSNASLPVHFSFIIAHSFGVGNGNPLQYSCLENPIEEPGGLQSMGSQRVGHG